MTAPTPLVTQAFSRIRYGSAPSVIDLLEPVGLFVPAKSGLRAENAVQSGKKEYLFARVEDQVRLDLIFQHARDQYQRVRWFLEDWAFQGSQFELWVDRFSGSCWLFEDSLRDQNGLKWTLNGGGSEGYADTPEGRGWSPTTGQYLSVALSQSSAATKTGFDDPLDYRQGSLVLDFAPTFGGADSATHVMIDTSGTVNRLRLLKDASNNLALSVVDAAGLDKRVQGAVSWPSGARVVVVATWATSGVLRLWLGLEAGSTISFTELTGSSGAGSGVMSALQTGLYAGSDQGGAQFAYGVYDTLAFYKRAWPTPGVYSVLPWYRPMWRNYFPYGELVQPAFEPQRYMSPALNAWRQSITVRNGVFDAATGAGVEVPMTYKRGRATFPGAGTVTVTFTTPEVDTNFFVYAFPDENENIWAPLSEYTVNGFTLHSENLSSTAKPNWLLVR